MARPAVRQARREAKQEARAAGLARPQVRQAGRQAAQQTRQQLRTPQPAPASAPAPAQSGGGGMALEYNPTAESQLNQPYQDLIAAGAVGSLGDVLGRMGQQGDMADIYGGGAADALGGAAAGMGRLAPLGGQYGDMSGMSLGQYGQLMNPNFDIQQGLAGQIQAIQRGEEDFDPMLTQQFGDQERVLREQLRRNLGSDYETSSAGIEALSKFNQQKTTTLGSAQFNRLNELVGMQQGGMGNIANTGLGFGQFGAGLQGQQFGQGAQLGQLFGSQASDLYNQAMGLRSGQLGGAERMLGQTGAIQNLYANVPRTLGEFGERMAGMSGAAVNAQQPYQQDRFGQFQASRSPTQGEMWGRMAGQSGDRWIQVGNQSIAAADVAARAGANAGGA